MDNISTQYRENTETRSAPFMASPSARYLYNHDIMNCTADGVLGNCLYSARALGMTNEWDAIQLSPDLKTEWEPIRNHYARVGLNHTHAVIWDTDLDQISRFDEYHPSVFFFGEDEHYSHGDQKWLDVTNFINSKNNFMALAEELGVPVPQTLCFDRVDEITEAATESFKFPCYLKAAISVSGVGIYRCATAEELLENAKTFDPSTPVQVQEEVLTDCFLNMQYKVVDGKAQRWLTTEQILEGAAHQGNIHPPRCEPWDVVEPMAQWMAEQGFKDVFAFDVAVIDHPEGERYLAIECNPRYNGASYPTAIAMKLGIDEWVACYFKTRHRSLAEINLDGLEYDAETGEGVVIVNWGPILVGKVMVLLAGDRETRQKLEAELVRRIW